MLCCVNRMVFTAAGGSKRSRRPMFDLGVKRNPGGQVNDGWIVWPKRVALPLPGQQEVWEAYV